jgi:tetratricopeptide (TPR) repeat protein
MKAALLCLWLSCIIRSDFTSDDLHASFWANYNGFNKNPATAFTWYKKHLCKKNLPGYMYRGLLHLFKHTNNFKQIISLMPIVEDTFVNDIDIQMIFIYALQQTNAHDEADTRLITLASKIKDNQEITFHTAHTYLKRKEPENALSTVNDYLTHAGGRLNNFIFYFLKAQIYIMLDKKTEAIAEIKKSLKIHPSFDKGWLLYGLLHEQIGKIPKAIKGYQSFLKTSTKPIPHMQEHLLRLLFKKKLLELKTQKSSFNLACFEQALMLFKEHKYRQALEKIDESLIKQPHDTDNKALQKYISEAMSLADLTLEKASLPISAPFYISQSYLNSEDTHFITTESLNKYPLSHFHHIDTQALMCYKNNCDANAPTIFDTTLLYRPHEACVSKQ